jgi:hypothetical protein
LVGVWFGIDGRAVSLGVTDPILEGEVWQLMKRGIANVVRPTFMKLRLEVFVGIGVTNLLSPVTSFEE